MEVFMRLFFVLCYSQRPHEHRDEGTVYACRGSESVDGSLQDSSCRRPTRSWISGEQRLIRQWIHFEFSQWNDRKGLLTLRTISVTCLLFQIANAIYNNQLPVDFQLDRTWNRNWPLTKHSSWNNAPLRLIRQSIDCWNPTITASQMLVDCWEAMGCGRW